MLMDERGRTGDFEFFKASAWGLTNLLKHDPVDTLSIKRDVDDNNNAFVQGRTVHRFRRRSVRTCPFN